MDRVRHARPRTVLAMALAFGLAPFIAPAQPINSLDWSHVVQTSTTERVNGVAVGPVNKQRYVVGTWTNTSANTQPGLVGLLGQVLTWLVTGFSLQGEDGVLINYAPNGTTPQWTILIGGSGNDGLTSICTDPAGNIYVAGYYSTGARIIESDGDYQALPATQGTDLLVASFTAGGVLRWYRTGGGLGADIATGVAHANGKVLVTGQVTGRPDVMGLPATTALGNTTQANGLLLKFHATNGTPEWRVDGQGGTSRFNDVSARGGQVFVLGTFNGANFTCHHPSGTQSAQVAGSTTLDAALIAIDQASGAPIWLRSINNPIGAENEANAIVADDTHVYICGITHNGSTFAGVAFNAPGVAHAHAYLAKHRRSDGAVVWMRPLHSDADQHGVRHRDLALDANGNIWITGTVFRELRAGSTVLATSVQDRWFPCILQYHPDGRLLKGLLSQSAGNAQGNSIATEDAGKLLIGGEWQSAVRLDVEHTGHASPNMFVAGATDNAFTLWSAIDPAGWTPPAPLCDLSPPIVLDALLHPVRSGTGKTVVGSANISTSGADNGPQGALGTPDAGHALFLDASSYVRMDMEDTLPAGSHVLIRWIRTGATGNALLQVAGSMGSPAGPVPFTTVSNGASTMQYSLVQLSAASRHIQLARPPGSAEFAVSGVYYAFGSTPGGTWSGTGVSGGSFDPAGLSGNIPLAYSVDGHTTTHTVQVVPMVTPGTLSGGGSVCPGSDATLTLGGHTGNAFKWQVLPAGEPDWISVAADTTAYTLAGVVLHHQVRVIFENTACPFAATAVVEVIPLDTTPPVPVCPSDTTLVAHPVLCTAQVALVPTATDDCAGHASITFNSSHPASFNFPIGTTTVDFRAYDGTNWSPTCQTQVHVGSGSVPVFSSCPGDITIMLGGGQCSAVVNYAPPTATDPCAPTDVLVLAVNQPAYAPGQAFGRGSHTVSWTATGTSGISATCSFIIHVVDGTPPVIQGMPANVSANATPGCTATATWAPPTFTDNCTGGGIARTAGPAPGSTFPIGSTTITYTATDAAGNTASASFNVVVSDNTAPLITGCPGTINVNATSGCSATAMWTGPTFTDNCSGGSIVRTTGPPPGGTFPIGTTHMVYTATDAAGNTSTCSFDVVVADNTAPVISGCPGPINVNTTAGCTGTATWAEPMVADNCAGASITRTAGPASGSAFPIGTTSITYTATDAAGNTSTCSFDVVVADNTAPVISGCPGPINVNTTAGCTGTAIWTEPTFTDNCSGGSIVRTTGPPPGGTFPIGTTHMVYTATDAAGNTSTCSFDVVVADNTTPVISGCPGTIHVSTTAGCTGIATWAEPMVADNCAGASITRTAGPASGSAFPIGITSITYTATDAAGHTTTCTFSVVVSDLAAPVISGCPATIHLGAGNGCTATATWTPPTFTDNCAGGSIIRTTGPAPGSSFPPGATHIVYTATDAAGNATTCSFDVVVTDSTAPSITGCPGTVNAYATNACTATATWGVPAFIDNCAGGGITQTTGPAPGSTFAPGATNIVYTATDAAGNSATCSFNVVVIDSMAPVISGCPADLTLTIPAGQCTAVLNYTTPSVADNCTAQGSIDLAVDAPGHASGSALAEGTHVILWTATDAQGNSSTCSFAVEVLAPSPVVLQYAIDRLCHDASDPQPTSASPPGGVFSGTTGLAINTATGVIDVSASSAATHLVQYTIGGPCPRSTNYSITIDPLPTISAGADQALCQDADPVDLPAAFDWSGPGVTATAPFRFDPATVPVGAHTLTAIATNAFGCSAPDQVVFTVKAVPVVQATSQGPYCDNIAPVTLQPGVPAGGTWSGPGVLNGTFDPSAGTAGIILSLTVDGCTGHDTTTVIVHTMPAVDAGTYPAQCVSAPDLPLDQATPANGDGGTGTWSGAGLNDGHFDPGAQTQTLTYTFITEEGCQASDATTIEVNDLPTVSAGNDTTVCANSGPLLLQGTPANGSWSVNPASPGSNEGLNGNSYDPSFGTQFLTYGYTDAAGCHNAANMMITVPPLPEVSIDVEATHCADAGPLPLVGVPGGGTWSGPQVVADGDGGFILEPIPGVSEVTYTFTDAHGCTVQAEGAIEVLAPPVVDAGADLTLCTNDGPVDLAPSPAGRSWSGGEEIDGQYDPSSGSTSLLYTYTDTHGCSASDALSVQVNTPVQPTVMAATITCMGADPVHLDPMPPGGSWTGGTVVGDTYDPAQGTAVLTYTFVDTNGCTASATTTVTVPEMPAVMILDPGTLCSSSAPITLEATHPGGTWSGAGVDANGIFDPSNGSATVSYLLVVEGCTVGASINVQVQQTEAVEFNVPTATCSGHAPTMLMATPSGGAWSGNGVASSGLFNPSGLSGPVAITYTVDIGACSLSGTTSIMVLEQPVPNAGPDAVACEQFHALAAVASTGSGSWNGPADCILSDPHDPHTTVIFPGSGTYTFTWIESNEQCQGSDAVSITFHDPNDPLWADAGPDQDFDIYLSTPLAGSVAPGASAQWQVLSGSATFLHAQAPITMVTDLSVGDNVLLLTASFAPCRSVADTVHVRVNEVFIPQGFSPNGDGVNDLFEVTGALVFPDSRLRIHDRWGIEVHTASPYRNDWDGRGRGGSLLPDGTYYYFLDLTPERTYKGFVVIKR